MDAQGERRAHVGAASHAAHGRRYRGRTVAFGGGHSGRGRLAHQLARPPAMSRGRRRSSTSMGSRVKRMRIDAIDALRGGAICLMVVYHGAFDLRYYGVTRSDFEHDPFWLSFRALIVSSFMALVGVSLVLAENAHSSRVH